MVRRKSLGYLVVAFCMLVGNRAVDAAIIITTNSSAPSDHVLTGYSFGWTNFATAVKWTADSYDHMDCGQSFLVSGSNDWSLDKITVHVREFGTSVVGQGYSLELWNMSNASDISGDTLVSSQSDTFPSSGLTAGYWTFDMPNVTLTKGNYYAFLLGFNSGPDSERFVDIVESYTSGNPFPDGRQIRRAGAPVSSWTVPSSPASEQDIDFYIQGNVVPEPSTIVLLATGVASLLFMAWRGPKRS